MNYQYRNNEYNRTAKEADRVNAKAYGRINLQQSEALKSADQIVGQQIQLARMTGRAAASGKVGRSAQRLDADP